MQSPDHFEHTLSCCWSFEPHVDAATAAVSLEDSREGIANCIDVMADPVHQIDDIPEPDISHLVTEDDAPVESWFQERQMRMLTEPLYISWSGPPDGRKFLAAADVGVYGGVHEKVVVPDVMLALGVTPPEDYFEKRHRCYFVWEFGTPPLLTIEVVSGTEGDEEEKLESYARLHVSYVVIYDPEGFLNSRPVRSYQLEGMHYVEMARPWFPDAALGLTTWSGEYKGVKGTWLRWIDVDEHMLAYGEEAVETERQRADAERQRADAERQRADAERQRAERLAERLRALGVDDV
ncbi:MAG: Uma2 family endonuclease [Candidatus Xenobia bacterium]